MCPADVKQALEDEAQKQALIAKQRKTLGAHSALAVDESSFEQMSEPGWLPLLALMLLAKRSGLTWRKTRRRFVTM